MTDQLDMFADPAPVHVHSLGEGLMTSRAKSRRSDPDTSREAARSAEHGGTAGAQRNACLAEVERQPGQTAAEIAKAVGLERHAPSRRLPELRDAGLVVNGDARICSVTGNHSLTWLSARRTHA